LAKKELTMAQCTIRDLQIEALPRKNKGNFEIIYYSKILNTQFLIRTFIN
jgi:hypothetical protein